MTRPDYKNCITNIIASIEGYFGLTPLQTTHPDTDALLSRKPWRNIVLLLYDGLSVAALKDALPEDAFLRRRLRATLSSVFPPTTTAAVTSLKSGLNPVSHGWIGWSMYLPALNQTVDLFPNRLQFTGEPPSLEKAGQTLLPYSHFLNRLREEAGISAHEVSPHGDIPTVPGDREDIYRQVTAICKRPGQHMIYAYDGNPDHLMHEKGTRHPEVLAVIQAINQEVEAFAAGLPEDSLLLITADHGLVDADYKYLSLHPDITDCLLRPYAVEGRAASFFIKEGMHKQFEQAFRRAFQEHFILMTTEEFLEKGFLGPGSPHPDLRPMLGDYMALAIDNSCLAMQPGNYDMVGVHAGLTRGEMEVPLIVGEA